MYTRIRNMHPLGLVVAGAIGALVLSGTAIAVTDASFTYSTVQTGYLMIGPADLVPEADAHANSYHLDSESVGSFATEACFRAPVHLPQGARMISVRTSYYSGAASDLSLSFRRFNPVSGAAAALIEYDIIVDHSNTRTFVNHAVPANLGLVSNALYTYTYRVCVGSGSLFYGARITYTYTNAGD